MDCRRRGPGSIRRRCRRASPRRGRGHGRSPCGRASFLWHRGRRHRRACRHLPARQPVSAGVTSSGPQPEWMALPGSISKQAKTRLGGAGVHTMPREIPAIGLPFQHSSRQIAIYMMIFAINDLRLRARCFGDWRASGVPISTEPARARCSVFCDGTGRPGFLRRKVNGC